MSKLKKYDTLLWCLIFLGLFFVINRLTPLHSDDYSYSGLKASFDAHLKHYMTWSGRVLADYVSSILLNLPGVFLKAFLNSLVFVGLTYSLTSTVFRDQKVPACVFFVTTLLYWVSNPSLGQTSFWIVGAANYLWTTFFVALYIMLSLNEDLRTKSLFAKGAYLFSAFFAGLSNENTSLALLFFMAMYLIWDKVKENKIHKQVLVSLIPLVMGMAILLLAPGNTKRSNAEAFEKWYSMSIFERLQVHVFNRMLDANLKYLPLYIFIGVIFYIAKRNRWVPQARYLLYAKMFFLASLAANFVMIASPGMPRRSFIAGFLFLMLSALSALRAYDYKKVFEHIAMRSLVVILVLHFSASYLLMVRAYYSTLRQEAVRIRVVEQEKMLNKQSFSLPSFFFLPLVSERHKFDDYHNDFAVGQYYGVAEVKENKATFDYSELADDEVMSSFQEKALDQVPYSVFHGKHTYVAAAEESQLKDSKTLERLLGADLASAKISSPMQIGALYYIQIKK